MRIAERGARTALVTDPREEKPVWRSFVLVQSTVNFLGPRQVPFPRIFWDAVPEPTGLQLTGSPEEVDALVAWLAQQRENARDEMARVEFDFAVEQVGYAVDHQIAPPPSCWSEPGGLF